MEFRVLGALEVSADGRQLGPGGARQQIVLAVLLLNANRSVTLDRLVEAIYDDDPPATARAQVQICISALRRLINRDGHAEMIVTTRQGYTLRAPMESIDAHRFDNLVGRARKARDQRQPEEAISHYRSALSLWRGPALDGIESRYVQALGSWLTEQRITANEECVQLELDLGRHQELVGELSRLVKENPLREGLIAQLMTALYRSGRQAESLQVYRDARRSMVDELGIEPNERLQQLEAAILGSDDSLAAPAPPTVAAAPAAEPVVVTPIPAVPRMLPADIADFVGRQDQIDRISRRLTMPLDGDARFAVPIVAIAGRPGIGKTTIAIHAAHTIAEHFPDGQLFANLHGALARPVSPMQVLDRFLRAFGVRGSELPETLVERAEMFRMLLADRKVLIVLDDAESESQVLPLMPGNPPSAVIVTSRHRLGGLAGTTQVGVAEFDVSHAVELLSHIAGEERVLSEPESAAALAELCCCLPLALRIAGARLAVRMHWGVDHLVDRLRDEARRLDELSHGDMGIRASLSLTYENISAPARCLFRRLALLDSPVFSAWAGAAVLAQPLTSAQDLFDDLADAHLVEVIGTGGASRVQYRFHDLIRVYARERLAAEEDPAERTAALSRVLNALHCLLKAAHDREYGASDQTREKVGIDSWLPEALVDRLVSNPIGWFERERHLLVSGIRQAAQAGLIELCWRMASNAEPFFELRGYLDDWRESHEIALDAARQGRDERGQAEMLIVRASLAQTEQRFDDARRDFEAALTIFERIGDVPLVARSTRNLAFLKRIDGQLHEAMHHLEQALIIFTDIGDQLEAAITLQNLAAIRAECGDIDEAKILLAEALVRGRDGGSRRIVSQVLHRMGRIHLQANEFGLAAGAFEESLTIVQEIGDTTGEAYALHGLGVANVRRGRLADADTLLDKALALARRSRHKLVEAHALAGLGELAVAADRPRDGVEHLRKAALLYRQTRIPLLEARTLIKLSDALWSIGDTTASDRAVTRVMELVEHVDERTGKLVLDHLASVSHRAGPADLPITEATS
ncbi:AfsR/SARP family transcriptional regulator [Nonomuraea monospora]|uniref:AfsR/SARP family transcriptional regulator n=1 Tax=Nonomuraea monospora TaxID=568818 RepID=UPI0031D73E27